MTLWRFLLLLTIIPQMQTSAAATTTIASACLTCGTTKKSGKLSCCARGGSWFGNCGATVNAKLQHTWYEGIQACKARKPKTAAMGLQRHDVLQHSNKSSNDADSFTNSGTAIMVSHMFAITSVGMSISGTPPFNGHADKSIQVPTTMSTRTSMNTLVSNNDVPASPSIAHDTNAESSKIIATTTTASANTSTRMPAIPPAGSSITILVKTRITPAADSIITKLASVPFTETFTDITPFHAPASASTTAREVTTLGIAVHISMVFFITVN